MPNSIINKDSKRGYGSKKKLENDWDEAKDAAGKKGGKQNWALTNYIYQRKKKHASLQTNAAARLLATKVEALMSNSAGGVQDEIVHQLKAGKYQVQTSGGVIKVLNGTVDNVAGALRYKGWVFNKPRMILTHPSSDYFIKVIEANGVTTLKIMD